jgi:hypothetical protein
MAQCLKELNVDAQILCVDTWLGALEFWGDKQDPQRYQSLRLENGFPRVYYQFLANVVKSGFEETIVPFPQTSEIAARWLRKHDVSPDLIYIDASHEEEDVFRDLLAYWQILAAGGIIFGDDYDEYWPGVRAAVRRFSGVIGLAVADEDGKWVFRKPTDWQPSAANGDEARTACLANATRFEVIGEQLTALVHFLRAVESDARTARQELEARNQEILVKDRELRVKDQQLRAAEEQRQQELLVKDQQLRATEEQRRQELLVKDQQLQAANRQIEAVSRQLQAAEEQVRAGRQERLAKDRELQTKSQQLQAFQAELQQTRSRLSRWENWFRGVLGSRTWRWVAQYTVGRVPLPTDP